MIAKALAFAGLIGILGSAACQGPEPYDPPTSGMGGTDGQAATEAGIGGSAPLTPLTDCDRLIWRTTSPALGCGTHDKDGRSCGVCISAKGPADGSLPSGCLSTDPGVDVVVCDSTCSDPHCS